MKEDIIQAAAYLRQGRLIVYPTDTLYALGADVFNDDAIRAVFTVKQRPLSVPLPVAVASYEQMEKITILTNTAKTLIDEFLPGELTLVVEKKPVLPDIVTGGAKTVAIRIPDDPIALELLKTFGPLTVTSANIHTETTPYSIDEIKQSLPPKSIAFYINDGPRNGTPSTIVDCSQDPPKILRVGSISSDAILSKV